MPLYLRTLGGLRLEGSSFRRPKPLLLLAYLALEGTQPRYHLAELFFMDTHDKMNSLSRALSYLRQEVPGVIEADNKKVWATISCDAAELLNLTDAKQFEKCLELYQGAFVMDYDLELRGDLEEWVLSTRDILKGKAKNAFLGIGESEAAKGNFSQAALLAEKAYRLGETSDLEPDDFGRLYNLLYAGSSPLAAEVKREAEEFEIPLELSREEAKAHLSEASDIKIDIPNNLPPPKTSFVGRDQELIEIAMQLAKKDCRLLTLHGMGGIGKSRLAIQAATEQLQVTNPAFKDGVYFVTLDALTSSELIPSSIAEALGLELQGQEDTLTQVKRFIGKKHILLLLDNYEHLMAGATLTSKLLEACPNLKLLVTSRERLNVEEEWVLTLDGLTVPTSIQLSEVERFDALHLFVQRAKRAMLEFSLTQETLPHALKICQLVEGSPLGIELAAVWVKTLPVSEIAKEIESNLSVLEAPTKNMAERHQSIRAAFEHSWKLLSAREQEVLRKLSVFVGGFRREAAVEVVGATLPILASLVDKSLLRVSEDGRYDRHPLLYQFSLKKFLEYSEEEVVSRNKHATYYSNFLQRLVGRNLQNESLNLIELELRNIEGAFKWLVFTNQFGEKQANSDLDLYFVRRAKFQEGIRFFSEIAAQLDGNLKTQSIPKALMMLHQAALHCFRNEYSRAETLASKSLMVLSKIKNPRYLGLAQTTSALIAEAKGDFAKAKSYCESALANAKVVRDYQSIGTLHFNLSQLERNLGNYSVSYEHCVEALNLFRQEKNSFGEASVLLSLGELKLELNQVDEALSILSRTLNIASEIKYYALLGYVKNALAQAHLRRGNADKAHMLCEEALQLTEENGEQLSKGIIHRTLGEIALLKNQLTKAKDNLQTSFLIIKEQQRFTELQTVLVSLSKACLQNGSWEEANYLLHSVLSHSSSSVYDKRRAKELLQTLYQNKGELEKPSVQFEGMSLEVIINSTLSRFSNSFR
jgi:predicted ATPase